MQVSNNVIKKNGASVCVSEWVRETERLNELNNAEHNKTKLRDLKKRCKNNKWKLNR